MSQTSIILNGKSLAVPREFFDIAVKASFGQNPQANISTEEFTFVLDAYTELIEWINAGRANGVGIFEGVPLIITSSSGANSVNAFTGIVDLQDGAQIFPDRREVRAKIRQDEGLNQLADLIEPLDFGYLVELGVIGNSDYVDIDYVVVKLDSGVETITILITAYLLQKQLRDTIKDIADSIGIVAGIAVSGISGPVGAAIYAVASAIAQVIYAAALLILLLKLGKDLLNLLVPPERTHKGVKLKTLLEKTCEQIGYAFNTTVEDLENVHYLPSNTGVDQFGEGNLFKKAGSITQGIPNVKDQGYTCTEIFEIARNLFNGRFAILDGAVQFHTESSLFWLKDSGWIKPNSLADVEGQSFRHNTEDLKSSINISFQTDITDGYTIENFTGTNFQVLTDAKTVNNPHAKTIKNADFVALPLALGTRKNELNPFEKTLAKLAGVFDKLAGVFGGKGDLAKKIKSKVGVLQVSDNNHAVPKLLWLSGGKMPENHRDLFSARTLWDKYHSEKSFVANNFKRQRQIIEGEEVPFGFADFITLLDNSYFQNENGVLGKITEMEWNMSKDKAIISYWIEESYTNNLKETFIEP